MALQSTNSESILPLSLKADGVVFERPTQTELAWDDVSVGINKWRTWFMLGYQDIKLRYRRSVLGPFWLTLSMAITVYSMGFLYAYILHVPLEQYFPFLIGGMLSWSFISTIVMEMTDGFTASDSLIKQIKLPYTLHLHRIAFRNILIFFHNVVVIFPILAIYHQTTHVNLNTLLLFPGLMITYINSITYGTILAMVGARYRDVSQIVKSLIQVVFFVTPVLWVPSVLGERLYYLDFNPFYAFIEIIRQPLLGHLPSSRNLVVVSIVSLFGILFSFLMLKRYRARIIYWL